MAIGAHAKALPAITMLRDVEAHFDDYARDKGRRWQGRVTRRDLQVGSFDGTTFHRLDISLNIDDALSASETLYQAVRNAVREASNQRRAATSGATSGEVAQ